MRGLAENAENSNDLASYIESWLTTSLKMKDVPPPLLSQAYRIARANNPTRPFPRDIIITFCSSQMKKKMFFDCVKESDSILHHKDKIQVFLDSVTLTYPSPGNRDLF